MDENKLKLIISATEKGVTKAFKTLRSGFSQIISLIGKVNKIAFNLKTAFIGLGTAYAAKKIVSGFLETASSFQKMQLQLDALTKGRGIETLEALNAWAKDMPVNTQEAVAAFIRMKAMGLEPTIEKMTILTDTASILGDEVLGRVSRALGQMQTLGKLSAEELNQLSEAGINARKYLSEAFGKSVEQLQKSQISITEIIDAIWKGLNRDFGGASEAAMNRFDGLLLRIESSWTEFKRLVAASNVFGTIEEQLKTVVGWIDTAFQTGTITRWAQMVGAEVVSSFETIKTSVQAVYNEIIRLKEAGDFTNFGVGLPEAMAVGAKGALFLIQAVTSLKTAWDGVLYITIQFVDWVLKAANTILLINEGVARVVPGFNAIGDAIADVRAKLETIEAGIQQTIKGSKEQVEADLERVGALDAVSKKLAEALEAQQKITDQRREDAEVVKEETKLSQESLETKTKSVQEFYGLKKKLTEKDLEQQKKSASSEEALIRATNQKKILAIEEQLAKEIISAEQAARKKTEIEIQTLQQILEIRQKALEGTGEVYGKESNEYKAALAQMITASNNLKEAQLNLIEANKQTADSLHEITEAATDSADAIQQTADSSKDIGDTLEGQTRAFNRLSSTVMTSSLGFEELKERIERLQRAGARFLEQTNIWKQYQKALAEQMEKTSSSTERLTQKLQDQANALSKQLSEIGTQKSALESLSSAYESIKDRIADIISDTSSWFTSISSSAKDQIKIAVKSFRDAADEAYSLSGKIQQSIKAAQAGDTDRANELKEEIKTVYDAMVTAGREALSALKSEWSNLASEIERTQSRIASNEEDIAGDIREIQQNLMTDLEKWNDDRAAYDELIQKAREAAAKGEAEKSAELFEKAKNIAKSLAREVKDDSGETVKSIEETSALAIQLINDAGTAANEQLLQYKKDLIKQQKDLENQIKSTQEQMENLGDIAAEAMKKTASEVDKLAESIERLENSIASLITQLRSMGGVTMGTGYALGGEVLKASGGRYIRRPHGRLPGESKKDSIPVMARPGEWFIKNEAGQYWGDKIMHGINNPFSNIGKNIAASLRSASIPLKMSMGGMVSQFANGGNVSGMDIQDFGKMTLEIGGKGYPVMGKVDVIKELKTAIKWDKMRNR